MYPMEPRPPNLPSGQTAAIRTTVKRNRSSTAAIALVDLIKEVLRASLTKHQLSAIRQSLIRSIIKPTRLTQLIILSAVIHLCAITQPQIASSQTRVAQRNEFYVPKPSTIAPVRSQQTVATPVQTQARTNTTAASSKVLYTNLRGFNIPFKVDNSDESFIEVHLYASNNQGETWEFLDRQPTTATEFPFQSNGEGEYWFAIKTLDRNRRLLPAGDPQPELRIIVDTTKPKLEVAAAADPAGRIVCRWNASDVYLAPTSLQLLYKPTFNGQDPAEAQSSEDSQWQSVTVNTPNYVPAGIYVDQLAFWPETTVKTLDVRVVIADEAGNTVSSDRRIEVQTPTWRYSNRSTARPTDQPSIDPSRVPHSANAPVRNMKCEDGSCDIAPVAQNDPQWKRAFYSKLRPESPNNYHVNETASDRRTVPPAIFRSNPHTAPAKQTAASNQNTAAQQLAAAKATATQRTAMLIGSEPEFAAPPTPAGWTLNDSEQNSRPVQTEMPRHFRQFQQSPSPQMNETSQRQFIAQPPLPIQPQGGNSSGDVWASDVQRDATQPQTSTGSTMAPDHRMLPIASGSESRNRTDSIEPNPNSVKDSGDQWVSKSSTNFPSNQYRGLDSQGLPTDVNSEIAPNLPGGQSFAAVGNSRPIGQMLNAGYAPTPDRQASFPPSNASSQIFSSPAAANIGRASVNGPTKTNTQIISTKRFRLNYDINAIDPSGVGRVDLYITQDKGRSWKLWGQDPDNQSPFPVEVQDQGLYGFRVVIHSKDGLAGTGPSSGDDADMWVRIDTQTPLAQITSVPYGRGNEAGRLVINYRVADDFLTMRPVRLSYSRSPQGPWTIIEDNLRNEGRYLWKVDRTVADRIFLKIDAMDQAGNVGTHRLSQSVDVSGLVPRGTIHGVEPVGR